MDMRVIIIVPRNFFWDGSLRIWISVLGPNPNQHLYHFFKYNSAHIYLTLTLTVEAEDRQAEAEQIGQLGQHLDAGAAVAVHLNDLSMHALIRESFRLLRTAAILLLLHSIQVQNIATSYSVI